MKEKIAEKVKKKGRLGVKLLFTTLLVFLVVMISTSAAIIVDTFEEALNEKKEGLKLTAEYVQYLLYRNFPDYMYTMEDEDKLEELIVEASKYGEFVDDWLENGADEYYDKVCLALAELKDEYLYNDVYIYKAARDENGELINDMTIVFDTPDSDATQYKLGDHFGASQAFETIKKVYETREAQAFDKTGYNGSRLVIAAFGPVQYSDGSVSAVVGVEASVSNIFLEVLADKHFLLSDAAINFILFAIIIYFFVKHSVVKPVNTISYHMNRFVSSEGSLDFKPITEIHTRDEIEQIADDFNALAQRTIDYTKDLEQKTTEEERLRVDLDVASQIRSVISSEPTYPPFPERRDFDLCASLNYTMYNRCSFCNYFFAAPDHLFIVAGEPLGNSFASMLFSVLAVSYIKSFAKLGFEPYKNAMETNNELCSIEKTDAGLTVGIIIIDIDLKTGVMKYVNAGMPPILIKNPGENYILDKPDKPFSLGQMRGVSFEQNTLRLYQGSTILLTSFGVTGMCAPGGAKYGFERLTSVMNRISGSVYDLDKTIKLLEKDLDDFRDGSSVSQDTMILGFRYFG